MRIGKNRNVVQARGYGTTVVTNTNLITYFSAFKNITFHVDNIIFDIYPSDPAGWGLPCRRLVINALAWPLL